MSKAYNINFKELFMKNMKIGQKLFVGFAVPIALMIIIAILVVVMNLLTVDSITTIGEQTDLWNYAAAAQSSFLQARDSANNLTYEYSDEALNEALGFITPAQEAADMADIMTNENPAFEQFNAVSTTAANNLRDYTTSLNQMAGFLKQAATAKEATTESGAELQTHMTDVFDGQIARMEEEYQAGGGAEAGRDRASRMDAVDDLFSTLAALRVNVRGQLSLYDADEADETLVLMDEFSRMLTEFKAINVNVSNQQSAQVLIDDIEEYKANFQSYVDFENQALVEREEFRNNGDAATEALTTLAAQNDAVNGNVSSASTTAFLSLFIIAGIVVAALVITVIMALTITRAITTPINYVTKILTIIGSTGRTVFTEKEKADQKTYAAGKDEMGECAKNLGNVVAALNGVSELLSTVADGDLTVSHKAMSEDDKISASIIHMIDNLNYMFREIDEASEQVSGGASQISNASQNLAEGSTEQAATVEELSASIADVAEKTKLNADRAVNAAKLSETLKANAEKGSEQMSEMTQAVSEINQASQDISKVIKVIDDIAFQTNILALNAAVEAARAGEAGKGFAVVADEVRNLASKSAAAAKETGTLIENSMKKAELGTAIAAETATSLSDIVDGINQSTDLITEIAESSEAQSLAISQINDGIVQVSEVVQKNSATAEESAASAEELNAQAAVLQGHISRFKLK
jgi:methyl-accepting chemotaxis protein